MNSGFAIEVKNLTKKFGPTDLAVLGILTSIFLIVGAYLFSKIQI